MKICFLKKLHAQYVPDLFLKISNGYHFFPQKFTPNGVLSNSSLFKLTDILLAIYNMHSSHRNIS